MRKLCDEQQNEFLVADSLRLDIIAIVVKFPLVITVSPWSLAKQLSLACGVTRQPQWCGV